GPRRPQARARVRERGHGRPQARRVRSHPHVPRPRGRPAGEAALMAETTPTEVQRVRAQARVVRGSARKARVVLVHIRGKSLVQARAALQFTPRAAAKDILATLESAAANAEANHDLDPNTL